MNRFVVLKSLKTCRFSPVDIVRNFLSLLPRLMAVRTLSIAFVVKKGFSSFANTIFTNLFSHWTLVSLELPLPCALSASGAKSGEGRAGSSSKENCVSDTSLYSRFPAAKDVRGIAFCRTSAWFSNHSFSVVIAAGG